MGLGSGSLTVATAVRNSYSRPTPGEERPSLAVGGRRSGRRRGLRTSKAASSSAISHSQPSPLLEGLKPSAGRALPRSWGRRRGQSAAPARADDGPRERHAAEAQKHARSGETHRERGGHGPIPVVPVRGARRARGPRRRKARGPKVVVLRVAQDADDRDDRRRLRHRARGAPALPVGRVVGLRAARAAAVVRGRRASVVRGLDAELDAPSRQHAPARAGTRGRPRGRVAATPRVGRLRRTRTGPRWRRRGGSSSARGTTHRARIDRPRGRRDWSSAGGRHGGGPRWRRRGGSSSARGTTHRTRIVRGARGPAEKGAADPRGERAGRLRGRIVRMGDRGDGSSAGRGRGRRSRLSDRSSRGP